MKNVKSDTKYIIKRILIGVGIAIILFNLKKCNVYAEDINKYGYFTTRSSGSVPTWRINNSYSSSQYFASAGTVQFNPISYEFDSYLNNNLKFNLTREKTSSTQTWVALRYIYNNNEYSYFVPISNDNSDLTALQNGTKKILLSSYGTSSTLLLPYLVNITTTESTISSDSSRKLLTTYYGTIYFVNSLSSNSPFASNYNYKSDLDNSLLSFEYDGDTFYNYFGSQKPLDKSTLDSDYIILENTNNWFSKGSEILEPDTDPLANYTKVDLTGYQAVLLVPKNYQTMLSDSSHTNESPPGTFRTYLDLEYYSQECVRGTLINVENVQDIILNNIGVGTGNIAESVTGTCYEEPTQTIMSYEFDQYSGLKARGLLVYNGSQDWQSGFGTETPFFGTSYVWYDPAMYNAYLVESFDNFNQTISYKDYSGTDKEVSIESLPTFTESMENAIENVDSPTPTEVNKQKIQAIFQFLKSPFSFLNKLNTTSCTPIDLPFPRSNQNIHLECLSSSVYDRYLPTALKSIIIIIINGLLFYRCTLSNIDIFTDILDPEDNKLEAVQL